MGTPLIASGSGIAEIFVIVIIVIIIAVIVVLRVQQSAAGKGGKSAKSTGAAPPNYYSQTTTVSDPGREQAGAATSAAVTTGPTQGGAGSQADPFAALSHGINTEEAPSPAAADDPSSFAPPPAGTAAGWLTDPSGATDTLRYWDGNAWTSHVAQRSAT